MELYLAILCFVTALLLCIAATISLYAISLAYEDHSEARRFRREMKEARKR